MCVLFYTLFIAVIESIVNIVVNILLNVRGAVLLTHKKMHSYTILGQKRNHTCWYTNVISYVVGVTGLEPAASRPPDACATNCATPRNT